MALYAYKDTSFKRGHRVQNIEETFAKGMSYTSAPLAEGYNRVLVNLDMQDSGNSVTPRLGLRTDAYMYNGWPSSGSDESDDLFEIASAHAFEDRNLLSTIWYKGRVDDDPLLGKYVTVGTIYCDNFDYPGDLQQNHAAALAELRLTHTAHLMSNLGGSRHSKTKMQKIKPESNLAITSEWVHNTLGIRVVGTGAEKNNY